MRCAWGRYLNAEAFRVAHKYLEAGLPGEIKQSNPAMEYKPKAVYYPLAAAIVILLMICSGTAFAQVDPNECVNGAADCVVENKAPSTILLWAGVLLLSLLALVVFKARTIRENRDPTILIGLTSMAVLNTAIWMAIYYSVSFLLSAV
jgi:hypothetical protein